MHKLPFKQHCISDTNLIVTGDLNCHTSSVDITSGSVDSECKDLLNLYRHCDITDLWRKTNPNKVAYTWVDPADPTHRSRIDYILVTPFMLEYCSKCIFESAPAQIIKWCSVYWKILVSQEGQDTGNLMLAF